MSDARSPDETRPGVVPCAPTSYGAAIEDAKRRIARGERETYCPTCGCWRWPETCPHPRRLCSACREPLHSPSEMLMDLCRPCRIEARRSLEAGERSAKAASRSRNSGQRSRNP